MKHVPALLLSALLVACSSTPLSGGEGSEAANPRPGTEQFGRNTPLPVGSKLRSNESMLLGVGDNWLGRAVFDVPTDLESTFANFAEQFPRQGWTAVTAMRGKKSLLVFSRSDRSATVEIETTGLLGQVQVTLTLSPTPSGAGAPSAAPAPGGVVVQPVRRP